MDDEQAPRQSGSQGWRFRLRVEPAAANGRNAPTCDAQTALARVEEARAHRWLGNAEADHGGGILGRRAVAHEPGAGAAAAEE
jgi:hypothetical protein